jgi:hypothetical protein
VEPTAEPAPVVDPVVETSPPAPAPQPAWIAAEATQPRPVTPSYAPAKPAPRSNRLTGILVALLGGVAFGILYVLAVFVVFAITRPVGTAPAYLVTPIGYLPVVWFTIAFMLFAIIANRAGWWAYATLSILIAIVVYLSYVATVLVTVQAWRMTPEQFASLAPIWWSPLAIVPAVIAREVPVWFGAWIAHSGARVKAQNAEAAAPETTD